MNILEELKYYCEEPKPVGALMITGEWGCGKTYLLNNMLTDELKDTHIILRVSLFGMESIEEIRTEVICFCRIKRENIRNSRFSKETW